jgi:hypothetical protein
MLRCQRFGSFLKRLSRDQPKQIHKHFLRLLAPCASLWPVFYHHFAETLFRFKKGLTSMATNFLMRYGHIAAPLVDPFAPRAIQFALKSFVNGEKAAAGMPRRNII